MDLQRGNVMSHLWRNHRAALMAWCAIIMLGLGGASPAIAQGCASGQIGNITSSSCNATAPGLAVTAVGFGANTAAVQGSAYGSQSNAGGTFENANTTALGANAQAGTTCAASCCAAPRDTPSLMSHLCNAPEQSVR
jgi:hypothetical protein